MGPDGCTPYLASGLHLSALHMRHFVIELSVWLPHTRVELIHEEPGLLENPTVMVEDALLEESDVIRCQFLKRRILISRRIRKIPF